MIAMSFRVTDTRDKLKVGTEITTQKPDKVCCNLDNNMRSSNNWSSSPQWNRTIANWSALVSGLVVSTW